MFVLKLKRDEVVKIGEDITLYLADNNTKSHAFVAIDAPREIPITRVKLDELDANSNGQGD